MQLSASLLDWGPGPLTATSRPAAAVCSQGQPLVLVKKQHGSTPSCAPTLARGSTCASWRTTANARCSGTSARHLTSCARLGTLTAWSAGGWASHSCWRRQRAEARAGGFTWLPLLRRSRHLRPRMGLPSASPCSLSFTAPISGKNLPSLPLPKKPPPHLNLHWQQLASLAGRLSEPGL